VRPAMRGDAAQSSGQRSMGRAYKPDGRRSMCVVRERLTAPQVACATSATSSCTITVTASGHGGQSPRGRASGRPDHPSWPANRDLRSTTTTEPAERRPPCVPAYPRGGVAERCRVKGGAARTKGLASSEVKPISPAVISTCCSRSGVSAWAATTASATVGGSCRTRTGDGKGWLLFVCMGQLSRPHPLSGAPLLQACPPLPAHQNRGGSTTEWTQGPPC
jgi:hypothetical protein